MGIDGDRWGRPVVAAGMDGVAAGMDGVVAGVVMGDGCCVLLMMSRFGDVVTADVVVDFLN